MPTPRTLGLLAVGALAVSLTTGCVATYDERMDYLRKVAKQGVEVHDLITSQEGEPDKKRCEAAFEAVSDRGGSMSKEWKEQIKAFFVDSCVSGVPRKVDAPGKDSSGSLSPSNSDEK